MANSYYTPGPGRKRFDFPAKQGVFRRSRIGRFLFFFLFSGYFLFIYCVGTSSAECIVFGPRDFPVETGGNGSEEIEFQNPNPAEPEAILIVEHGLSRGADTPSAVSVFINGKKVITPKELARSELPLRKQVTLKNGNRIVADWEEDPGPAITIRMISSDETAPVLTISHPGNNPEWVLQRNITVSGAITDPAALINVNGSPCKVDEGSFSCSLDLEEGENLLTVEAADFCGNVSRLSRTVLSRQAEGISVIDTRGGTLHISDPSSPLFGTRVEIPRRVLKDPTPLSAAVSPDPPPEPDTGICLVGPLVEFDVSGEIPEFSARVRLPFSPGKFPDCCPETSSLRLLYYDEAAGIYLEFPARKIEMDTAGVSAEIPRFLPGRYAAAVRDANPPVSRLSIVPDPFNRPAVEIAYVRKDFDFYVLASDPPHPDTGVKTGIREKLLRVDGGEWQRSDNPWREPFFLSGGGFHTIEYYSVDMAGNTEDPSQSLKVYVDDSPPEITSFSLPRILGKGIIEIHMEAADRGCGSEFIRAGLSETPEIPPDRDFFPLLGPVAFPASERGGKYTVFAWAKDCVGNVSRTAKADFVVDADNPTLTVSAPETRTINRTRQVWVRGTVKDSTSAVNLTIKFVEAGIDKKRSCPRLKTCPFSERFSVQPGFNTFIVLAVDKAGNRDSEIRGVFVDPIAPVTTPTVQSGDMLYIDYPSSTWYIHPRTRFALISKDTPEEMFDPPASYYRIGKGDFQVYQDPFTVPGDGFQTVEFYSIDAAGNQEEKKNKEIFVDAYPPEVKKFAVQPESSNPEVQITASETSDVGSGVWKHALREILGADQSCPERPLETEFAEERQLTSYRLLDTTPGPHTICVWFMDRVGNVSSPVSSTTHYITRSSSLSP